MFSPSSLPQVTRKHPLLATILNVFDVNGNLEVGRAFTQKPHQTTITDVLGDLRQITALLEDGGDGKQGKLRKMKNEMEELVKKFANGLEFQSSAAGCAQQNAADGIEDPQCQVANAPTIRKSRPAKKRKECYDAS